MLSLIIDFFFDIRKLAEYFQDLDVVPSDLAAGLVLLRKQQKRQEHQALVRAIEEQQVLDSQVCKQTKSLVSYYSYLYIYCSVVLLNAVSST